MKEREELEGVGEERYDGLLPEDAIVAVDAAGLGCCWEGRCVFSILLVWEA